MKKQSTRNDGNASQSASVLVQLLLGFLNRNLEKFSPPIQNLIGVTVLLLLVVVVLHAFAPTYVEGRLYVQEAEDRRPMMAQGYSLIRGTETYFTDSNGNWMMPAGSGLIPHKTRVELKDEEGHYHGDYFTLWGPLPIVSALWVSHYNVVVNSYKKRGVRISVSRRGVIGAVQEMAESLTNIGVVHAQSQQGAPSPPYMVVHLDGLGDVGCRNTNWCGTRGESRRLEGFSINLPKGLGDVRLRYLCYIEGIGDQKTLEGQFCGTRGQSKRLEGFAVYLEGRDASKFSVAYQAWLQDRGATPVMRDGAFAGTRGERRRVEAVRVWIDRR
jgi:hypothetical protein